MINNLFIKLNFCFQILNIIISLVIFEITFDLNQKFQNYQQAIDCTLLAPEQCYFSVQNFIGIKEIGDNNFTSQVKTYIYSFTKPFLIELIQNSTKDCICCENHLNQHFNFLDNM